MDYFDIKSNLEAIKSTLGDIQAVFGLESLMSERNELLQQQTQPDFYNDQKNVQKVGQRLNFLDKTMAKLKSLENQYKNIQSLFSECSENDVDILQDLSNELAQLSVEIEDMRLLALLNDKYDKNNAILTIQSGAGGTEACDWAMMLERMYLRYCEKQGFKVAMLDRQEGDEAGIKSVTLAIQGDYAYGYLKAEKGVHRLVRISPFDSNARRHTSFASVEVMPEINDEIEIEIPETDIRIDTFHAGGHGGQGVNTTDSAVRIKHLPTGIIVTCQNERSQIQNKQNALNVLRSKLAELEEQKRLEDSKAIQGKLKKIEWGSQIRSYVFCPYTMCKDHRTDYETSDIERVMDGDIQDFINEYLRQSKINE